MQARIPIANITRQTQSLRSEIDHAIAKVIDSSAFIGTAQNKFVTEFEQNFANYLNIKHCISCANGTDALEIALSALNIGKGDEVIVPAVSWISTSECVNSVGATPIFVDIEPTFFTIDPDQITTAIGPKTKAILVVHLYGQLTDMQKINQIAQEHNLKVIEDCAQAHGASYHGKKAGTLSDIATFSFFPSKNLACLGDSGCIVSKDDKLAEKCRLISNHGQKTKGTVEILGRNSRMDGIQASILNMKLNYLDQWNMLRNEKALLYRKLLNNTSLTLPLNRPNTDHAYHLFTPLCIEREDLYNHLKNNNIEANVHYRTPLPFLAPYIEQNNNRTFDVATKTCKSIISLPLCPFTYNSEIETISKLIINHL